MKIVEIIPSLKTRAGAETFFVNLCCELSKHKEVEIYPIVLFDGVDNDYLFVTTNRSLYRIKVK